MTYGRPRAFTCEKYSDTVLRRSVQIHLGEIHLGESRSPHTGVEETPEDWAMADCLPGCAFARGVHTGKGRKVSTPIPRPTKFTLLCH